METQVKMSTFYLPRLYGQDWLISSARLNESTNGPSKLAPLFLGMEDDWPLTARLDEHRL